LEHGYRWIYQRLFSHASIWRRRPEDWRAAPLYLAMSYLYKRSNRFWHLLIRHNLVHAVWWPLVEATRLRHVHFRKQLAGGDASLVRAGQVVSAGVFGARSLPSCASRTAAPPSPRPLLSVYWRGWVFPPPPPPLF